MKEIHSPLHRNEGFFLKDFKEKDKHELKKDLHFVTTSGLNNEMSWCWSQASMLKNSLNTQNDLEAPLCLFEWFFD